MEIKKNYLQAREKYDEILSAIGEYFDLFRQNTDRLEDLFLQILENFQMKIPHTFTVFKEIHYEMYKKLVINNGMLKRII
jgi:hypothetical protein